MSRFTDMCSPRAISEVVESLDVRVPEFPVAFPVVEVLVLGPRLDVTRCIVDGFDVQIWEVWKV